MELPDPKSVHAVEELLEETRALAADVHLLVEDKEIERTLREVKAIRERLRTVRQKRSSSARHESSSA